MDTHKINKATLTHYFIHPFVFAPSLLLLLLIIILLSTFSHSINVSSMHPRICPLVPVLVSSFIQARTEHKTQHQRPEQTGDTHPHPHLHASPSSPEALHHSLPAIPPVSPRVKLLLCLTQVTQVTTRGRLVRVMATSRNDPQCTMHNGVCKSLLATFLSLETLGASSLQTIQIRDSAG